MVAGAAAVGALNLDLAKKWRKLVIWPDFNNYFRIARKPLSAENDTAYRPVRFTSNIVMSSSLSLGSINNFRLEIVFAGLSDMAPRKRLSGSFPEIESVNPSVS